ncbi:hypothetical protein R5R35_010039 [Gryllus longicercus]|uniref:RNA helicase n=1 Tax=Gryllus longicercus TaxID=2509291 RepID=A0AAN9V1R0_9ORTH
MPTSRRRPVARVNQKELRGFRDNTNPLWCGACNILCESKISFQQHRQTAIHEYNYAVFTFEKHRNRKIQNRHKVIVRTKCKNEWIDPDRTGTIQTQILPSVETFDYKFELVNQGDIPIELRSIVLLHPYPVFLVTDEHEVYSKGNRVRIQPACCYNVQVKFTNHGRGTYGVPVSFKFIRTKDGEEKDFDIVRVIVVKVRSNEFPEMEVEESPFRGDVWTNVKYRIEGVTDRGKPLKFDTPFEIPEQYYQLLEHWLLPWDGITRDDMNLLTTVLDIALKGYENLDLENYEFIMHMLLYLEEFDALLHVNRYNMRGVALHPSITPGRLELKVPGLAEKRPSLLKRDLIYCRVRQEDGRTEEVEYEGQIVDVLDESIIISHFNPEFYHRFFSGNLQLDVRFSFSRYPISVMHCAVHNIVVKKMDFIIFPDNVKCASSLLKNDVKLEFVSKEVESNREQRQAVINIVKGVCRPAPYIIFGPPGTGKTITIVESILQIRKVFPQSRILVCAPSNAACDHVATRLVPHFKSTELLRFHSSNREWGTVPEILHKYSNRNENTYYSPTPNDLLKYRVVVCTLISANKLGAKATEPGQFCLQKVVFTHIFIDECGQAPEPEALVPIGVALSRFTEHSPSGMVVLAGDPCQLGPVCNSKRSENIAIGIFNEDEVIPETDAVTKLNRRMGLGISLLERLMVTCSLYQKGADGTYDNRYITKLLKNFRSHPDIIDLPNKLFYSGELIPACSDVVRLDPVRRKILPNGKAKQSCAVIFHGVIGQEKREGRSPSYFNLYETDQVMNYMHLLLRTIKDIKVEPSDIGIIAPYIRQVYKIKHALKQQKWDEVEVGTTETFQGREKRVMIISTVRSNRNLLDYDYRFRLGFVADPKRFNVAVTRAQSLLIVIGNPYQLVNDANWKKLIEFCNNNGSYLGSSFKPRNEQWRDHVVGVVNDLSIKD